MLATFPIGDPTFADWLIRPRVGYSVHYAEPFPKGDADPTWTKDDFRQLGLMVEQAMQANPRWYAVTFADLIQLSYEVLRSLLEAPPHPNTTWKQPSAQLFYSVPWFLVSTDLKQMDETAPFTLDPVLPPNRFEQLWDTLRFYMVLRSLSLGANYLKQGGQLSYAIPPDALSVLKAAGYQTDRESIEPHLAEFFRPFEIGRSPSGPLLRTKQLTFHDEAKLSFYSPHASFEANGVRCGWRFGAYPLVVDDDAKHAFFSVVPELLFDPSDQVEHWTERDKATYWRAFEATAREALESTWHRPIRLPDWCNVLEGLSDSDVDEISRIAASGVVLGATE